MVLRAILLSKKKSEPYLLFTVVIACFFFSCQENPRNQQSNTAQYNRYCGSCHLAPDPNKMPKAIWKNGVLPEMAARMGYRYNAYDPYEYKSPEEKFHIDLSKKYPEQPILDSTTWWNIHDYIISMAPNSIPIDTSRASRTGILTQFSTEIVDISELETPIITNIQFDTLSNLFNIGDAIGNLHRWPKPPATDTEKYNSPITAYHKNKNLLYVLEVGILNPSEVPEGLLSKISLGESDTIAKELHRPVFVEITDLDNDGADELLICEFGHLTGQLSLLEHKESGYIKKSLLPRPGAIKIEIADMDNDGKEDIVALFSQGDEGIVIFYQQENLQFNSEQVIRFEPGYGSSWFELLDYDMDGDLDIVMTNGDNADYSIFLKPYHGIRLFLNDGNNKFREEWFYPIYGATRVLADDYDLDGDIDFAVTAFFNDTKNSQNEGFVYLENLNRKEFEFQPYILKGNYTNGWLTMAKGDYDVDGDIDILIGSFNVKGLRNKNSIFENIKRDSVKLLILQNLEKEKAYK